MIRRDRRFNAIRAEDAIFNNSKFISSLVLPQIMSASSAISKGKGALFYDMSKLFYVNDSLNLVPIAINPSQVITVGEGGDFSTIKEGIFAASSALPDKTIVEVLPGTYTEDNPLVVPDGISVLSVGERLSTMIIAVVLLTCFKFYYLKNNKIIYLSIYFGQFFLF